MKRRALALAVVLMVGGCGGGSSEPAGVDASMPGWLVGLPRRNIEATPGETVWAVVPVAGSESAKLATYRLESASGATAVLVDSLGNRFADVPGALIHPMSVHQAEMESGTVVLADRWDADKVVGRVTSLEAGEILVAYDWNGATASGAMDAVMPLSTSVESLLLRWVAYRPGATAAWYKGLCFAESVDRVWISDDSGHVEIVARDAVKILGDIGRADPSVGDAVSAYSWGYGYRAGKVAEVIEPDLRYVVELEDGETREFFFDNLTQVL